MFADKNKIFTVNGRIIDQKTGKGVKGLRVEVWDKDRVTKNDYLNSAITDEEGFFQLSSDNSLFIEFIFDRKPDFFFRVYCGEKFIVSTESKIYWNVSQPDFELKEPITINPECIPPSNNLIYRVFGTVNDVNNNTASIRYTVRAFDRDNQQKETQLGSALTDEGDFYQIEFSQSAFREIDSTRSNPNLFVRVYNDKNEKIGESVLIENADLVTELNIDITLFRVHGTVTDSSGKFLKNNTVKVFDRDLRRLELLGITKTDAKGFYEITYNRQKFSRAEKDTADIEVHVGDGEKITKSEIHFNAPADTVINLVVPIAETQLSEFELLLKVICPLLKGQGENGNDLAIESLQPQDAEFLAKDTGEPIERINWLITATRISQDFVVDTKKEIDSSSNEAGSTRIPPAIFYAWMRKGLPDKLAALQQETPTALRRSLLEAIDELVISAIYKERVESYIALLGHPQWAEVKEFITAALTIDLDKRILLSQQIDSLDAIQDLLLTGLVQSKVLTEEESNQVGLAVSLHRLIRGSVNKLPRLLEVKPAKLGRPLAKSEDLARLDLSDWENLINLSEGAIPAQSIREYARNLEEIAVNAYPTIGLLYRSSRISDSLDSSFNLIKPKLSALKKWSKSLCSICDSDTTTSDPLVRLWELSINDPGFSEIASSLSTEQRKAVEEIQNHVRLHPGIDSNVQLGELQELCKHWGNNLNELIKINPDKDLLASDLSVFAAKQPDVHFADLPREPLLRELTSMQRMLVLAETPTKAQALMQAGLYSATQMALLPRSVLREKIKLSELSDSEINKLHERAITQANKNAIGYFAAKNEMQSFRMFGKVARVEETQQFDEVQKLFGNLDACECAHCLSVLSPSAYFVDLMYYIERYITAPQDPKLSLKERRADLWDLPLNCDSTNTIVPTLDIVNRILENWLKRVFKVDPTDPKIDLTIEIYNRIAAPGTIDRFNLPVNFPLQRLEILLAHFGLSRDRISRVVGGTQSSQRIQTRLQLTADEISIVTQPRTTTMSNDVREFFVKLYDIHPALLSSSNADAVIDERETDLSHFQHVTKLERNVLRKLILCQFVSNDGSTNGSVKVVMRTAPGDVQNNIESIQNLSLKRLDRLHRMIRLWRKLPWTVDELDYVITRLAKDRGLVSPELTAEIVGDIVNILDLADRADLPVDELLSLVSAIPDIGLRGDDSLFTRRFNTEPFATRDGIWEADDKLSYELKHPAYTPDEGVSAPDKNMLLRLLAALQLDDPQFLQLVQGLEALPVDDQGNTLLSLKSVIKVTLKSLHFLYRYARLAHLLGVKIPELLRLVRLALKIDNTTPNNVFIQSISDVFTVIKFADVQKTSGYALDEIEWLLESKTPSGTRSASDIATAVISRIAQERLLVISATTLTAIGLTELESTKTLKQLNESILDTSDQEGEYRFKPSINFEQISENINAKLSAALDFDVATTAILSYAAHLGEFKDSAFKQLYLEESDSKKIVEDNLAEGTGDKSKAKAFELIDPNANPLLYRLNPSFEQNRITLNSDIAGKMILNFADKLRKSQSSVILETVFQEIYLSAQQSRWLVMANTSASTTSQSSLFIKNLGGNGLIINPEFPTTLPSPNPGKLELDKLVTRQLTTLLEHYHWSHAFDQTVASELSVEPGRIAAFRSYVTLASNIPEILLGLKSDADQSLFKWIADAQRLQCLVKDPIFDTAAVQEILSYWPSLKTTPSSNELWSQALSTAAYARWLKAILESGEKAEVRRASLENIWHTATTEKLKKEDVANVLGVPVETIRSAMKIEPAPAEWFQQLEQWSLIVEIITRLGVSGETLYRMFPLSKAVDEVRNLWRAADDIHGAFRAKYQDDASYQKKAEAFEDVIRGKRRDALVTFLLETKDFEFKGTSDLYAYFLMDTEIGGCARTSELVAATSSLQLYVHRVLMGLEPNPSEKIAFNDARKRQEWSWRKHYRVWEANRKVFLFPENFIEPDLRDDKTPLFLDLENELLQQQITTPEAEQSYFKYLTGFSEVSSLKIVGAFHDNGKDSETHIEKDVLHLVGVTESDPPIHYLRQINNYKSSRTDKGRPLQYGPWKKLEAQIPAKWVSPVVYQRKLMLFWVEITTVSTTRKIDSDSYFDGYEHKFKVKYIEQRPDGSWSTSQEITFLDNHGDKKQIIYDKLKVTYADPKSLEKLNEAPESFRMVMELEKDQDKILTRWPIKGHVILSPTYTDNVRRHHGAPKADYTLSAWFWERVFPTIRITQKDGEEPMETLQIAAMNSDIHGFMPSVGRNIPFISYNDIVAGNKGLLPAHITDSFSTFELSNQLLSSLSTTIAPVGHHTWKATEYLYSARPSKTVSQLPPGTTSVTRFSDPISDSLIVNAPAKVSVSDSDIAPYRADAIIHAGKFQVLATTAINLVLLSSILPSEILKQLGMGSVPGILNIKFQNSLNETNPVTIYNISPGFGKGAFGTYVRETFFHIPFLIANHLNSQQRFSEAQQWYHYIFNPMDANGNTWQYREFSTLTVETMRSMLTNQEALEAYRQNPFNPDAIARTRLSAYQKSIVMKYIDNLLDWGDRLFTQFTMESVNEATMLYILASDILGERPAQLPRCMEEKTRTYAQIRPSLSDVSDFLIEEINEVELTAIHSEVTGEIADIYEPYVIPLVSTSNSKQTNSMQLRSVSAQIELEGQDFVEIDGTLGTDLSTGGTIWNSTTGTSLSELSLGNNQVLSELTAIGPDSAQLIGGNIDFDQSRYTLNPFSINILAEHDREISREISVDFNQNFLYGAENSHERQEFDAVELVSAKNVFCFPQNDELLAYWNRVEDRLSKIRSCRDISGLRRQLDLFAPEIDPRELIRMRAAGLSLDDVMDVTTGHAPPYRFAFLLEKARQYASTAQSLGNQLLAALEKRDGEELAAMRAVHEHKLLEMRKQLMSWERDASEDTLEGLNRQKAAIEYRKEHYEELLSGGLSPAESTQIQMNEQSLTIGAFATQHEILAAYLSIIPQFHVGPMPSTETGGRDFAKVPSHGAAAFRSLASYCSQAGQNAGLMSNFFRRDEEWKHQIALATHDLAQINKQIEAAEIRVKIAERSLEVHEKNIAQAQEVYDFYRNKFSKLAHL